MITHDPTLRLKIRIGVHSGATTAGVVGSKMPRYPQMFCWFSFNIPLVTQILPVWGHSQCGLEDAVHRGGDEDPDDLRDQDAAGQPRGLRGGGQGPGRGQGKGQQIFC